MRVYSTAAAASLLLSLLAAAVPAAAEEGDAGRFKPTVCGDRKSCEIAKLWTAGKSESGEPLVVVEAHLGLADKPDDSPDDGCRENEGDNDGGHEYWLVEGGKPPRQLLKLCNDGYGAAGRGMDTIEIADNRMSRLQLGGSNDRWQSKLTVQLAPPKTLAIERCGFRASETGSGDLSWIDVANLAIRSVAIDNATMTDANQPDDPCELLAQHKTTKAEPGFLVGIDIPYAEGNADPARKNGAIPDGTVLGSCAARLKAGAAFAVYGSPDPAREAELRLLAPDLRTIVVQVSDPRPDQGSPASWIGSDHLEVWTTLEFDGPNRPDPRKVTQIGVGLDGTLYPGIGKAVMPTVDHWQGNDEAGRPVKVIKLSWAEDEALVGGVTVAYSEAEGGKQTRIFANGDIVKNRPEYLPDLVAVPVTCGVVGGRWDVIENAGALDDSED